MAQLQGARGKRIDGVNLIVDWCHLQRLVQDQGR